MSKDSSPLDESEIDADLLPSGDSVNESIDESAMEDLWKEGQDELEKGQPEGTFRVVVKEATLGKSTSSGRTQIKYELKVAEGHESAGITLYKYDGLGTAKQVSMTMMQLNNLGINCPKFSLLPASLLDLQGSVVEVNAKKNGQFYNIFFVKRIDAGAEGISGISDTEDDELPF